MYRLHISMFCSGLILYQLEILPRRQVTNSSDYSLIFNIFMVHWCEKSMLIFTFGPFSKGKHVTILNCRAVLNLNLPMNLMKLNKLSRPDSIQR